MSTNNICFCREMRRIFIRIILFSGTMVAIYVASRKTLIGLSDAKYSDR